jgi:hypothetical protein
MFMTYLPIVVGLIGLALLWPIMRAARGGAGGLSSQSPRVAFRLGAGFALSGVALLISALT